MRQESCQQLKNWDDNADLIAYHDNFELVMSEAKFPQGEWFNLVSKQITGKTLSISKRGFKKRHPILSL